MNKELMFSKKSDNWSTPKWLYDYYINDLGYYDPCPLYDDSMNLKKLLLVDKKMFVNPPYSDIKTWVDWLILVHDHYKNDIKLLIPARTDTKYFHELLNYGVSIFAFKGRLKFGDSKNGAPFPSLLITLKGDGKNNIQGV